MTEPARFFAAVAAGTGVLACILGAAILQKLEHLRMPPPAPATQVQKIDAVGRLPSSINVEFVRGNQWRNSPGGIRICQQYGSEFHFDEKTLTTDCLAPNGLAETPETLLEYAIRHGGNSVLDVHTVPMVYSDGSRDVLLSVLYETRSTRRD